MSCLPHTKERASGPPARSLRPLWLPLTLTLALTLTLPLWAPLGAPPSIAAQPSQQRRTRHPATTFGLSVAVAEEAGRPAVSAAWLREQLRWANRLFGPHGVAFRIAERRTLGVDHARMETRRDRHALGGLLRPGLINLFVVRSLRDVDDPARFRMGVHWRPRGEAIAAGAHLVILSQIAHPTVLAHELGHFFGNPHSEVPGNIMSYDRGDSEPFFDPAQSRRIRRFTARFLSSGELTPERATRRRGRAR